MNENIFPDAQNVEYLGDGDTYYNLFFKVRQGNKYGVYVYDTHKCEEEKFYNGTEEPKGNLNRQALREVMLLVYDEIELIFLGEE
ncbi:hypothetical protein IJX73_01920 [bacterium]|nr:hypothetical protein [bacterium]MBQ9149666.1 hypothetical protein [bacterium]